MKNFDTSFRVSRNDPKLAGQKASPRLLFGEFHQYAVFAVHSRFGGLTWFVTDAEQEDEVTGGPKVIRQADTLEAVVDSMGDQAVESLRLYVLMDRRGELDS